jgi:hypothetical protein
VIGRTSAHGESGCLPGLIEPRSDEGPASVDKEGNAECEHDDFGTDHSVSRVKLFNVGP